MTLAPFTVYTVVALLYVSLCWPLSFASRRLEGRLGRTAARLPRVAAIRAAV